METSGSVCGLPRRPPERSVSRGFKDDILSGDVQLRVLHSTCRATHQFIRICDPKRGCSSPICCKQRGIDATKGLGIDLNGTLHPRWEAVESFRDGLALESMPEPLDVENVPEIPDVENSSSRAGVEDVMGNLTQTGHTTNVEENMSEIEDLEMVVRSLSQTGDVLNSVDNILQTKDVQNDVEKPCHAWETMSSQTEDVGNSQGSRSEPGYMTKDAGSIPKTGHMEGAMENISESEATRTFIYKAAQTGDVENTVGTSSRTVHSTLVLVNTSIDPSSMKDDLAISPQTEQPQHVCDYLHVSNLKKDLSAVESVSQIGQLLGSHVATHIDSLSIGCSMQNIPQTDRGSLIEPLPMENASESIGIISLRASESQHASFQDILSVDSATEASLQIENVVETISQTEKSLLVSPVESFPSKSSRESIAQTGESRQVSLLNSVSVENAVESSLKAGESHLVSLAQSSSAAHAIETIMQPGESKQPSHLDPISGEKTVETVTQTDGSEQVLLVDSLTVKNFWESVTESGKYQQISLLNSLKMKHAMETIPRTDKPQIVSPVHTSSAKHFVESIKKEGEYQQVSNGVPFSMEKAKETIPQTGEPQKKTSVETTPQKVVNAMEAILQTEESMKIWSMSMADASIMKAKETQQISPMEPMSMESNAEMFPGIGESPQGCEHLHEKGPNNKCEVLEEYLRDPSVGKLMDSAIMTIQNDLKSMQMNMDSNEVALGSNPIQKSLSLDRSVSTTLDSRIHPEGASLYLNSHHSKDIHINIRHALNILGDITDLVTVSDGFPLKSPEAPATPDLCSEDRLWSYCNSATSPSFSGREEEEDGKVDVEECEKEKGKEPIAAWMNRQQGGIDDKEEMQGRMLSDKGVGQYAKASLPHEEIAAEQEIEELREGETKEQFHTLMKQNQSLKPVRFGNHTVRKISVKQNQSLKPVRFGKHTVRKMIYFSKVINISISKTHRNICLAPRTRYMCRSKSALEKLRRIIKTNRHGDPLKLSCAKLQDYLDQCKRISTEALIICNLCDLQELMPKKIISAEKKQRGVRYASRMVNLKRRMLVLYLHQQKYRLRRIPKVYRGGRVSEDCKSPVKKPPEQWRNQKQLLSKMRNKEEWNNIQIDDLEECLDTCLQDLHPLPLAFPALALSPYCKVLVKKVDLPNSELSNGDTEQIENRIVLDRLGDDIHSKLLPDNQIDGMQRFACQAQGGVSSLSSCSQSGDKTASSQIPVWQESVQTCCSSTRSKKAPTLPSSNVSNLGTELTIRMHEMKSKEKLKQCAEVFLLRRHIVQQQRRAQLAPPYPPPQSSTGNSNKCNAGWVDACNMELIKRQGICMQRSKESFGSGEGKPGRRSTVIDVHNNNAYHAEHTNLRERCHGNLMELYASSGEEDCCPVDVESNHRCIVIERANHQETGCASVVIDIEELQKYVDVQFISQAGIDLGGGSGTATALNQSLAIPDVAAVIVTIVALVVYTRILCHKALARVGLRSSRSGKH